MGFSMVAANIPNVKIQDKPVSSAVGLLREIILTLMVRAFLVGTHGTIINLMIITVGYLDASVTLFRMVVKKVAPLKGAQVI